MWALKPAQLVYHFRFCYRFQVSRVNSPAFFTHLGVVLSQKRCQSTYFPMPPIKKAFSGRLEKKKWPRDEVRGRLYQQFTNLCRIGKYWEIELGSFRIAKATHGVTFPIYPAKTEDATKRITWYQTGQFATVSLQVSITSSCNQAWYIYLIHAIN